MRIRALDGDEWVIDRSNEEAVVIPTVYAPLRAQAHGSLRKVMRFALSGEEHLDNSVVGRTVVSIGARFDEARGHYLLEHLGVSAPEDGEVTGVLLREIAPQRIMRWALARAIRYSTDENGAPHISRWARDYLSPHLAGAENVKMLPVEGGPNDENIRAVAEIYRIAEAIRDAPAKAVADTLGLQQRTATNWINRAKTKGLLDG